MSEVHQPVFNPGILLSNMFQGRRSWILSDYLNLKHRASSPEIQGTSKERKKKLPWEKIKPLLTCLLYASNIGENHFSFRASSIGNPNHSKMHGSGKGKEGTLDNPLASFPHLIHVVPFPSGLCSPPPHTIVPPGLFISSLLKIFSFMAFYFLKFYLIYWGDIFLGKLC